MKPVTYADYCARAEAVARHVHERLDRPPTVAELADVACMSPFHFQRVFARVAGEKIGHLVRRLRLERAAWCLQNTDQRIGHIAVDAGFESQEAFARAFRAAFASPATEFRERQWISFHLLAPSRFHFAPAGEPEFEPLSLRGQGTPFELVETEPMRVRYRAHEGAPSLIGKTTRELAQELRALGCAPPRMVTFSPNLSANADVAEVRAYVGVEDPIGSEILPETAEVGGGLHLLSRYEGTGDGLGDHWIRVWADAIPGSRTRQRPGPCYQLFRLTPSDSGEPMLSAEICIPVEGQFRT